MSSPTYIYIILICYCGLLSSTRTSSPFWSFLPLSRVPLVDVSLMLLAVVPLNRIQWMDETNVLLGITKSAPEFSYHVKPRPLEFNYTTYFSPYQLRTSLLPLESLLHLPLCTLPTPVEPRVTLDHQGKTSHNYHFNTRTLVGLVM